MSADHDPQRASHCLVCPVFDLGVMRLRADRRYLIGRDAHATIRLPSKRVSRKHAVLRWSAEEGGFTLEDKGSLNGMCVNGKEVARHVLRSDDLIEIGNFELRYRVLEGDIDVLLGEGDLDGDATQPMQAGPDGLPTSSRLAGRFSRTDLFEICQLIDVNQKSGRLEIEGVGASGTIHLFRGGIVQADAGALADVEAARALLELEEGTFRFLDEGKPTRPMPSPVPLRTVVLDVARERDEWSGSGLRQRLQASSGSLPSIDTQHD